MPRIATSVCELLNWNRILRNAIFFNSDVFVKLSPEALSMHFCSQNISLEYYIKNNKKIISCYWAHAIRGGWFIEV